MNQIGAPHGPERWEHSAGVGDFHLGQAKTPGSPDSQSPRGHSQEPQSGVHLGEHGSSLQGVTSGWDGCESAAGRERLGGGVAGAAFRSSTVEAARPLDLRGLLLRHRLIPNARLSSVDEAVPLAKALKRAGLPLLEVALSSDVALHAIEAIRTALPDFLVGAGTVLSVGHLKDARAAGAQFGSGPAMHPGLLASALSAEFPFLPGAMTPTEIECGMQWGFSLQCFSPAAAAGGTAMVRALVEPYRHTRLVLVPAGGVRMADFQEYLVIPEVGAVAGRFLCEGALIEAGMWEDIEAQAALCIRKAASAVRARLVSPQQEAPLADRPEEIYH